MAPKYKLIYFDARGRAEIARLVFTVAQVPFEDVRIEFTDWLEFKSSTQVGVLPMLEIDGKKFSQALAIATYLAREFGLYGSSNMDGFMIDQVQQQREDLMIQLAKMRYGKDEETRAEEKKKLDEVTLPLTLKFFCEVIKNNTDGDGFAVGNKLSLADLVIYEGTQFIVDKGLPVLDNFPEIKALRSKVDSVDTLTEYLRTRPQSKSPFQQKKSSE